ncbi:MAG: hypothetical protein M1828_002955 [Chrysothrix sp. TS-e1954]|nr:MAG: hypothetical protein M1828_002955 [Chrysothrix sp. TS-e1954]
MPKHTHILVFGATGPSGIAFCDAALASDLRLTLYVRTPSKLPARTKDHSNVQIMHGTFSDADGLAKAAACGATAFVSFAGPIAFQTGMPVTNMYTTLLPLLQSHAYTRALVLSTASWPAPGDASSWKYWAIVTFIRLLAPAPYVEIVGSSAAVAAQDAERLGWTLFRVPLLTSRAGMAVRAGMVGDGGDGSFLTREGLAAWVLQELEEGKWVGKAPLVCDA